MFVLDDISKQELMQLEHNGLKPKDIPRTLKFKNWPFEEDKCDNEFFLQLIQNNVSTENLITEEQRMGSYV